MIIGKRGKYKNSKHVLYVNLSSLHLLCCLWPGLVYLIIYVCECMRVGPHVICVCTRIACACSCTRVPDSVMGRTNVRYIHTLFNICFEPRFRQHGRWNKTKLYFVFFSKSRSMQTTFSLPMIVETSLCSGSHMYSYLTMYHMSLCIGEQRHA